MRPEHDRNLKASLFAGAALAIVAVVGGLLALQLDPDGPPDRVVETSGRHADRMRQRLLEMFSSFERDGFSVATTWRALPTRPERSQRVGQAILFFPGHHGAYSITITSIDQRGACFEYETWARPIARRRAEQPEIRIDRGEFALDWFTAELSP